METSIHTVDLFKIPDVHQRLKRRHRAPAASYPDVSLLMKMCAQRKAGRRQRARLLYPSHGPLRFITCHSFCARLCHAKNESPEEEAGAPAFKTIVNKEFGLVRNQHQFLSSRINCIPRTYIVRPKTCYCQKQSSQDPIFPSHARDQSFTRVAQN